MTASMFETLASDTNASASGADMNRVNATAVGEPTARRGREEHAARRVGGILHGAVVDPLEPLNCRLPNPEERLRCKHGVKQHRNVALEQDKVQVHEPHEQQREHVPNGVAQHRRPKSSFVVRPLPPESSSDAASPALALRCRGPLRGLQSSSSIQTFSRTPASSSLSSSSSSSPSPSPSPLPALPPPATNPSRHHRPPPWEAT